MKRRRAIQTMAAAAAALPLLRVSLAAAELTADQIFVLRDVAGTVLPSSIGRKGQDEAVDGFLKWLREYTSEDANRTVFRTPPAPRTLSELKEGVQRYIKRRYASR